MNIRNQVQLIGNLGKDAEFKRFDNGNTKATVSIATNESYKNAKGEKVDKTEWHNLVAWGKIAEVMEKYFRKGTQVAIKGKLTHRTYQDKNGQDRSVSEIVMDDFTFLGKKPGEN